MATRNHKSGTRTGTISRAILFLALVLFFLAASSTSTRDRARPTILGFVESWTPFTRRVTRGTISWHHELQSRELRRRTIPGIGLAMVSVRCQDESIISPPSATTETLSISKPFENRVADILEFVDNTIVSSSTSSSTTIQNILERVRNQHNDDFNTAKASCLDVEERGTTPLPPPLGFERIRYPYCSEGGEPHRASTLAIRSKEPVLDATTVNAVKEAAEDVWRADRGDDASTSRFTYQYSGNSEAHVFDFITTSDCKNDGGGDGGGGGVEDSATEDSAGKRAISALNEALQTKLYPVIREAFFRTTSSSSSSNHREDGTRLFVYDALVIRYNSTEAAEAAAASGEAVASAGQPLHRDLGLVSINIMLNSADDFEGGGTFFENQLLGPTAEHTKPLRPSGVGYCLAHSASERHAGAGTTTGVRDILVLFVSAATGVREFSTTHAVEAPAEIRSARLKNCRSFCESNSFDGPMESEEQWIEAQRSTLLCRILHQRLAVKAGRFSKESVADRLLPPSEQQACCDGEAMQYLGTALMEYSGCAASDPNDAIAILEVASECFRVASFVTPCDSRVHNNLGIVLGTIEEMVQKHGNEHEFEYDGDAPTRTEEQETAYRRGLDILLRSIRAGCTNDGLTRDLESLSLNYGLFVANRDRFWEAAEILEPVATAAAAAAASSSGAAVTDAGRDAHRLWKYCLDRCVVDEHAQESIQ